MCSSQTSVCRPQSCHWSEPLGPAAVIDASCASIAQERTPARKGTEVWLVRAGVVVSFSHPEVWLV